MIFGFITMPSRLPGTEAARVEANLKKALGRDLTPEESRLLGLTIPVLPAEDPETDSPGNSQRSKKA